MEAFSGGEAPTGQGPRHPSPPPATSCRRPVDARRPPTLPPPAALPPTPPSNHTAPVGCTAAWLPTRPPTLAVQDVDRAPKVDTDGRRAPVLPETAERAPEPLIVPQQAPGSPLSRDATHTAHQLHRRQLPLLPLHSCGHQGCASPGKHSRQLRATSHSAGPGPFPSHVPNRLNPLG